jgi:hypothetical protein
VPDEVGDPNALPDPLITRPSLVASGDAAEHNDDDDDDDDYSLDAMLSSHLKSGNDDVRVLRSTSITPKIFASWRFRRRCRH